MCYSLWPENWDFGRHSHLLSVSFNFHSMLFNTPKIFTAFSLQFSRIPKAFHISMDFLNQPTYTSSFSSSSLSSSIDFCFSSLIHIEICKCRLLIS
ncbi:hypothetical protein HanIR_Chr14g0718801 [Helianthus annuus]|nr:hypothetical protein HanIR_Chr14g0718801 [Helianthus annuus]